MHHIDMQEMSSTLVSMLHAVAIRKASLSLSRSVPLRDTSVTNMLLQCAVHSVLSEPFSASAGERENQK